MKSNKQRRLEIKAKRREKAEKVKNGKVKHYNYRPFLSVDADHDQLKHVSYYHDLPLFYVDKSFKCRGCASIEVWTAKQQKWWYEVVKGHIDSMAVYCRPCRIERRKEKEHMAEMAERKPHPNEEFFRKRY